MGKQKLNSILWAHRVQIILATQIYIAQIENELSNMITISWYE